MSMFAAFFSKETIAVAVRVLHPGADEIHYGGIVGGEAERGFVSIDLRRNNFHGREKNADAEGHPHSIDNL